MRRETFKARLQAAEIARMLNGNGKATSNTPTQRTASGKAYRQVSADEFLQLSGHGAI